MRKQDTKDFVRKTIPASNYLHESQVERVCLHWLTYKKTCQIFKYGRIENVGWNIKNSSERNTMCSNLLGLWVLHPNLSAITSIHKNIPPIFCPKKTRQTICFCILDTQETNKENDKNIPMHWIFKIHDILICPRLANLYEDRSVKIRLQHKHWYQCIPCPNKSLTTTRICFRRCKNMFFDNNVSTVKTSVLLTFWTKYVQLDNKNVSSVRNV